MRILIAEDDPVSLYLVNDILSPYGDCDMVVNGKEAILAYKLALDEGEPYDLVCLDIMMPELNGQQALRHIRRIENAMNREPEQCAKVIMISALGDTHTLVEAFYDGGATAYLVKPIEKSKLIAELMNLELIPGPDRPDFTLRV